MGTGGRLSQLKQWASSLHWGQLLMLSAVLALIAGTAGLSTFLAATDRGICAAASTYSDSLRASRGRLAGIDRVLGRYDFSRADDPLVMLKRRRAGFEADNPLARIVDATGYEANRSSSDSLRERADAKASPSDDSATSRKRPRSAYSVENPFTERARVVRTLIALRKQGADSSTVKAYLGEREFLSPEGRSAGTATMPIDSEPSYLSRPSQSGSAFDLLPYDSVSVAGLARSYSVRCSAFRRGVMIAVPALFASLVTLFMVWWWWFGGRARKPETQC